MRHVLLKRIGDVQCCRMEVSNKGGETTIIKNGEGMFIVADGLAIEVGFADAAQNAAFDKLLAEFHPSDASTDSYSMRPLPDTPGVVAVSYMYNPAVVAANQAVLNCANPNSRERLLASNPIGREYYIDTTANAIVGESDLTAAGTASGFQVTYNDPATTDSLDDTLFAIPPALTKVRVESIADLRKVVARGRHP